MVDVCSGFRYWYSHVISSAWSARIPPMTGTTTMIRDSLRVPLFTDIVSIDVDDDAMQTRHTLLADSPTIVDLMRVPEWSRPRVRHTTGSVCRHGSPVPRGSRAPRQSRRRRNSAASGVSGTRAAGPPRCMCSIRSRSFSHVVFSGLGGKACRPPVGLSLMVLLVPFGKGPERQMTGMPKIQSIRQRRRNGSPSPRSRAARRSANRQCASISRPTTCRPGLR